MLQVPAQHDLRGGLAVRGGDRGDGRVVEDAAAVSPQPRVERDAADRRPRLGQDAVLGVGRLHVGLGEVGVQLDLVHRRHHLGLLEQRARWWGMKLLTPMARTWPSASSRSSAR